MTLITEHVHFTSPQRYVLFHAITMTTKTSGAITMTTKHLEL